MKKLILLATLGLGLSLSSSAMADNTCSPDVRITYQGKHGTSIKVVAFEYKVEGQSKFFREDVGNVVLTKTGDKTFRSQRLGHAPKGNKLDLRAIYRADTGRGYGGELKGDLRNSGKPCQNDTIFALNVN